MIIFSTSGYSTQKTQRKGNRMKRLLTVFSFMLLLVFTAASAQNHRYNEGASGKSSIQPKPSYPIHVSDWLNSPEFMKEHGITPAKTWTQKTHPADTVGQEQNFLVYNMSTRTFDSHKFRLMRKGNVSQLWFEVAEYDNGHLTDQVADTMIEYLEAKTFDESINPSLGVIALDNQIYGNPPDKDGDGYTDVFVTDVQDGWDPETGGGYVAGFFINTDQQTGNNSNSRDIIYIDSYPGIYNGSEANPLRPLATLAHEYQHLIHYNYYGKLGISDYTFLNEAQSQSAETMIGEIGSSSYWIYLANTNVPLLTWNSQLDDYGRAIVFTSYLYDYFGWDNAKWITQSGETGPDNITNMLTQAGSSWSYGDLIMNWGVANYVNDTTLAREYGYANPILQGWQASPTEVVLDPNVTDGSIGVARSGAAYLSFKGVSNLSITLTPASGTYAGAKVVTVKNDTVTVSDYTLGSAYTSEADVIYDEITFVLVNTEPSSSGQADLTKLVYTYNSTGTVAKSTAKTYSDTPKYYWPVPYYNSSQVGRFGFSNKYVVNPGGYLSSLKLYIVTGTNTDGETIEVMGSGKLRYAIYDDNNGEPGNVIAEDTLDFSEIVPEWNTIDVSGWDYAIWKNVPFHVVYEIIVPTVNRDINSIPLRLDDGMGVQNVTKIVSGNNPATFAPMFTDDVSGGEHGVWNQIEYLVDPAVSVETPDVKADEFRLEQNYPNPFNPTTVINYTLPKAEDVELTIYNALGQRVRALVSGTEAAGPHSVTWNGRDEAGNQVSSGIYFYRLKSASEHQVKKMILMR